MSTYLVLIPHIIVLYVLGKLYVIETHGLTSKREPRETYELELHHHAEWTTVDRNLHMEIVALLIVVHTQGCLP